MAFTKGKLFLAGTILIFSLITYTQLTFFVVPPIGAVPNGATILILRLDNSEFIDSPDSMCERIQGNVNILCRGMVLGAVGKSATILLRLPYIETLYLISTSGKSYSK